VRVLWTNTAVAQLEAIHSYITQTSPEYAQRIVDQLTRGSLQIATFPLSGRKVPEYELTPTKLQCWL
jgi:toxin ParE1/3/4